MKGSITQLVETLVSAGCTPDMILAAVRTAEATKDSANETLDAANEERKEKVRARVREWWLRLGLTAAQWRDISNAIRERDNFTCVYCGSQEPSMHVDHVKPLIQGGTNDPDNLATACKACNSGKSGRTLDQWRGHQ